MIAISLLVQITLRSMLSHIIDALSLYLGLNGVEEGVGEKD